MLCSTRSSNRESLQMTTNRTTPFEIISSAKSTKAYAFPTRNSKVTQIRHNGYTKTDKYCVNVSSSQGLHNELSEFKTEYEFCAINKYPVTWLLSPSTLLIPKIKTRSSRENEIEKCCACMIYILQFFF